jgi:hypothetical protein
LDTYGAPELSGTGKSPRAGVRNIFEFPQLRLDLSKLCLQPVLLCLRLMLVFPDSPRSARADGGGKGPTVASYATGSAYPGRSSARRCRQRRFRRLRT